MQQNKSCDVCHDGKYEREAAQKCCQSTETVMKLLSWMDLAGAASLWHVFENVSPIGSSKHVSGRWKETGET